MCIPDLVSKVTTNTDTIWSFSSHWSLVERSGKGTCVPRASVRGRPGLPFPRATPAVRLPVGLRVKVVAAVPPLVLHPVPAAILFGLCRTGGCELFLSSAAPDGSCCCCGAAGFGPGAGISSQSSSGARSDCFTMALLPRSTRGGKTHARTTSFVQLNREHYPRSWSRIIAPCCSLLVFSGFVSVSHPLMAVFPPPVSLF